MREDAVRLSADIEHYIAELVARLSDLLDDRLIGAWLFGSGALGDLDPATSDLDV
jgi:predicted nucleotidyltransferase